MAEEASEVHKLRQFAAWVIHEACWDGMEIDGGSVQDMAEKLGLIEPVTVTKENFDDFSECDIGDTAYRYSQVLRHVDLPT